MTELLDLTADQYHADEVADVPTLSASIAKILLQQSPAHAHTAHPRLNPDFVREEKAHFDFGSAVHKLCLENDDSCVRVIYANDWRKAAVQEERDAARAEGLIPLLDKDMVHVKAIAKALRQLRQSVAADPPLFTHGSMEKTIVWNESGVACRARLDWLRDDRTAIDDLKTTSRSANPASWARQLYSMQYDLQAAFYIRAVKSLTGRKYGPAYRLAIIETTPPYALSIMALSQAGMALANAKVDRALQIWKRCLATNVWPSYSQSIAYADPPAWAEEQFWASVDADATHEQEATA